METSERCVAAVVDQSNGMRKSCCRRVQASGAYSGTAKATSLDETSSLAYSTGTGTGLEGAGLVDDAVGGGLVDGKGSRDGVTGLVRNS